MSVELDDADDDSSDDSFVGYVADVRVRWRRRSISLSRATYDKLVAYAHACGEPMSKIVERWINESVGNATPTLALLTKQRDDARKYAAALWVAICCSVSDSAELGPRIAWDHYAKRWGAAEALRVYGARPARRVADPEQAAKPVGSLRSGPVSTDGDLGDCPRRV